MKGRCPTCGVRTRMVSGDDGTHYYEPVGDAERWNEYLELTQELEMALRYMKVAEDQFRRADGEPRLLGDGPWPLDEQWRHAIDVLAQAKYWQGHERISTDVDRAEGE